MEKVPVVPGLSRKKIEDRVVSILRTEQPEAFAGNCPVDIDNDIRNLYPGSLQHQNGLHGFKLAWFGSARLYRCGEKNKVLLIKQQ